MIILRKIQERVDLNLLGKIILIAFLVATVQTLLEYLLGMRLYLNSFAAMWIYQTYMKNTTSGL